MVAPACLPPRRRDPEATRGCGPHPPRPHPRSPVAASVDPALGALGALPAALTPDPRLRAVRAADRPVAPVVQLVVRKVVAEDVAPHVALAPVGERIDLVHRAPRVPVELGRAGS